MQLSAVERVKLVIVLTVALVKEERKGTEEHSMLSSCYLSLNSQAWIIDQLCIVLAPGGWLLRTWVARQEADRIEGSVTLGWDV